MALITQQMKRKIHIRNTDFFLKNYKPIDIDLDRTQLKEIVDVQLQCLGYGVFKPKILLDNFVTYTIQLLRYFGPTSNIRSLKITLNGFQLDSSNPVLKKLAKQIPSIKDNLNVLWIHTANLKNVTLQNFNDLLQILIEISNINFQDFSLQCANWKFMPHQPNYKDLNRIFDGLIKAMDFAKIQNKHFRLEMSGWFHNVYDAKAFLGFRLDQKQLSKIPKELINKYTQGADYSQQAFEKQLQKFFVQMQQLISRLLQIMQNIQQLELDMRHTNDILRFGELRKRLNNITKQNRYQMSIMSKKVDMQANQNQKELRLNIVM